MENHNSYTKEELQAVNRLLRAISEPPVDTLDNPGIEEPLIALDLLREVSRDTQADDWFFNILSEVKLTPDPENGTIALPENALEVLSEGPWRRTRKQLMNRGGYLWNATDATWVFNGPVTVRVRVYLAFHELPPSARTYIREKATRKFVEDTLGDPELAQSKARDEMKALSVMEDEDAKLANYNMADHPDVGSGLVRRNSYV